jgi:FtsZ-binding cell division protein ZapB
MEDHVIKELYALREKCLEMVQTISALEHEIERLKEQAKQLASLTPHPGCGGNCC